MQGKGTHTLIEYRKGQSQSFESLLDWHVSIGEERQGAGEQESSCFSPQTLRDGAWNDFYFIPDSRWIPTHMDSTHPLESGERDDHDPWIRSSVYLHRTILSLSLEGSMGANKNIPRFLVLPSSIFIYLFVCLFVYSTHMDHPQLSHPHITLQENRFVTALTPRPAFPTLPILPIRSFSTSSHVS